MAIPEPTFKVGIDTLEEDAIEISPEYFLVISKDNETHRYDSREYIIIYHGITFKTNPALLRKNKLQQLAKNISLSDKTRNQLESIALLIQ